MTATATPARQESHGLLSMIVELRAWIFLLLLVIFFEVWARAAYGSSFILNAYNLQAIGIFAKVTNSPSPIAEGSDSVKNRR